MLYSIHNRTEAAFGAINNSLDLSENVEKGLFNKFFSVK